MTYATRSQRAILFDAEPQKPSQPAYAGELVDDTGTKRKITLWAHVTADGRNYLKGTVK